MHNKTFNCWKDCSNGKKSVPGIEVALLWGAKFCKINRWAGFPPDLQLKTVELMTIPTVELLCALELL